MTCNSDGRLLQGYFDGELDLVRTVEFEEHVKDCPECAAELREQQMLRQSLQSSDLYERAPESLRARIQARLPGAEIQSKLISMQRRPVLEWLAVAAAIIIAVVLGSKSDSEHRGGPAAAQTSSSRKLSRAIFGRCNPNHLYDVESTDQHTVKPWFDGKLDFFTPSRGSGERWISLGRRAFGFHRRTKRGRARLSAAQALH